MYHADPLVCRQCEGKLKVVAYVSDEISVKRILTALGLSPPEDERSHHRSARWSSCRWTMKRARSTCGGIACGGDCAETYPSGTLVTITATAAPGSVFVGWSGGGCSGTDPCTLAVTSNATVTAEFDYTFVFTGVLALTLNQASFAPGDLLRVDVTVSNPGPEALVDVYFGALLPPAAGLGCPAADPIAFVAGNFSSIVVTCLSAPPESFPPLLGSFPIPAGLPPTAFPDFFTFGWTPDLPAGPYTFFLVLTPPDAFADGSVDPVDLLVVTAAGATFAP